MINIAWFLIGAVFGIVLVIIVSCCAVASETDRLEEKWYEEEYRNDSKDGNTDHIETVGHGRTPEAEEGEK